MMSTVLVLYHHWPWPNPRSFPPCAADRKVTEAAVNLLHVSGFFVDCFCKISIYTWSTFCTASQRHRAHPSQRLEARYTDTRPGTHTTFVGPFMCSRPENMYSSPVVWPVLFWPSLFVDSVHRSTSTVHHTHPHLRWVLWYMQIKVVHACTKIDEIPTSYI
jgi:hypothetical protein